MEKLLQILWTLQGGWIGESKLFYVYAYHIMHVDMLYTVCMYRILLFSLVYSHTIYILFHTFILRSSLDLRKKIPDSLLLNEGSQIAIADDMKGDNNNMQRSSLRRRGSNILETNMSGFFHNLFLNPAYPLRRQMLLTFGTVTSLTILLVMIVSIIAAVATGNAIKDEANVNVEEWVDGYTVTTSRLVAEALSPKIMVSDLEILSVDVHCT